MNGWWLSAARAALVEERNAWCTPLLKSPSLEHYPGAWMSTGRLVTVTLPRYGRKTAQLGDSAPGILARIILREIAEDQIRQLSAPVYPR